MSDTLFLQVESEDSKVLQYQLFFLSFIKKSKINRARVKPGGQRRNALPPPQFNAKQKFFCRNYPISFLFSHKEHLKRVFKASREAQMQNFKTMMVAVPTAYITVTIIFWQPHFHRYTAGPDQTN